MMLFEPDMVSPENWDIVIRDGQPVEMVTLAGLAELVLASPMSVVDAVEAVAPQIGPEHTEALCRLLGLGDEDE